MIHVSNPNIQEAEADGPLRGSEFQTESYIVKSCLGGGEIIWGIMEADTGCTST